MSGALAVVLAVAALFGIPAILYGLGYESGKAEGWDEGHTAALYLLGRRSGDSLTSARPPSSPRPTNPPPALSSCPCCGCPR